MAAEQVDDYQKVTKTGKVVTVRGYSRNNDGITQAVAADPTRPPLAGKSGTFAAGRFIPYVWVNPTVHSIPDPLIRDAKTPDQQIQDAIDADHQQSEIKQKYGVSSGTSKIIHEALQRKKEEKERGKAGNPLKNKSTKSK